MSPLAGHVQPDSRERFSLTRFLPGPAAKNYAVYVDDESGSIELRPVKEDA